MIEGVHPGLHSILGHTSIPEGTQLVSELVQTTDAKRRAALAGFDEGITQMLRSRHNMAGDTFLGSRGLLGLMGIGEGFEHIATQHLMELRRAATEAKLSPAAKSVEWIRNERILEELMFRRSLRGQRSRTQTPDGPVIAHAEIAQDLSAILALCTETDTNLQNPIQVVGKRRRGPIDTREYKSSMVRVLHETELAGLQLWADPTLLHERLASIVDLHRHGGLDKNDRELERYRARRVLS